MRRFFTKRSILVAALLVIVGGAAAWWSVRSGLNAKLPQKDIPLTKESIEAAIDRGIDFLEKEQEANGEFFLSVCDNAEPERCDEISSGPNTAAVILAISSIRDERIGRIIKKGLSYVKHSQEISPGVDHATWNIFAPGDPRSGRVPADVDSTSIASLVLFSHGVPFRDNEDALYAFRNSAGIFYNWLSHEWNLTERDRHAFAGGAADQFPDPNYFGIDCVVNADVLSYLAAKGKEPKEVCAYLKAVISKELYPECTFYYRNPYVLFASITTAALDSGASCLAPTLPRIKDVLLLDVREDGTWSDNPFSNILATLTLIRLGEGGGQVERAVQNILAAQQPDGGWRNAVIFPDLYNPVFYGSREMVTAVVLKTLFEYQKHHETN